MADRHQCIVCFCLPRSVLWAAELWVIGSGCATGRELAEFFLPSGPWGGDPIRDSVESIVGAYTLGVDTPQAMAERAAAAGKYSLLKLKLDGKEDVERVHAVRCARQDAELIVDANQAWTERELRAFTPRLAELGVKLIEQPLPAGQDEMLTSFNSPVPLCADEACQSSASLSDVIGKYQYINIKLDKTSTTRVRASLRPLVFEYAFVIQPHRGSMPPPRSTPANMVPYEV